MAASGRQANCGCVCQIDESGCDSSWPQSVTAKDFCSSMMGDLGWTAEYICRIEFSGHDHGVSLESRAVIPNHDGGIGAKTLTAPDEAIFKYSKAAPDAPTRQCIPIPMRLMRRNIITIILN